MFSNRERLEASTGIAIATALLALTGVAGLASAAENVHDGGADPDHAVGNSEEVDHAFSYKVDNVSNEGDESTLFVTFPDRIDSQRLGSFGGEVTDRETQETVSISSSASIVDGPDGDGIQETVTVGVQPEGERAARDLLVNVTGSIEWPTVEETTEMPVEASVIDPDGPDVTLVEIASVTVEPETTSQATVAVATGSADDVGTSSATLRGDLTELDGADSADVWFTYWIEGDEDDTLARTDTQTVSSTGPLSVDVADLEPGTSYVFQAHAEAGSATDAGSPSTFATETENTPAIELLDGEADPDSIQADRQAQHAFTYTVSQVSNDGSSVKLFLVFPDHIDDDRLSSFSGQAEDADTGDPVSIASSVSIVDGPDGDGVQETVTVGVQPSGDADRLDLRVTFTGDVTWPQVAQTVRMPLEAAVHDETARDLEGTEFATVTVEATDEPAEESQDEEETTDEADTQAPEASGPAWTFGTVEALPEADCPAEGCWEMARDEIDPDGGPRQTSPEGALVWVGAQPAGETYETGTDPWTLSLHCTEQTGGSIEIAFAAGDLTEDPTPADTVTFPTERCEGEDSPVTVTFEPSQSFTVGEGERPVVRFEPVDDAAMDVHAKPDAPDTQLVGPASLEGYPAGTDEVPWPATMALAAIAVAGLAARRPT